MRNDLKFYNLLISLNKERAAVKIYLFIVAAFFVSSNCVYGQAGDRMSFRNPAITHGDGESLVQIIESAVIIPGDTHEDLWVHPEIVTTPGRPVLFELRARTTDRRGKDQHTVSHYFQSDDYFKTLTPIEEPAAEAWTRIRLSIDDLTPPENDELKIPESLGHTWASAYLHIGGDTILQSFTTRNEGRFSVQSLMAIAKNKKFMPIHISNSWTNETGRGLYEPQIAEFRGKYYMTARAEDGRGYLLVSCDRGLSWEKPVPWKWDNGEIIAMNQTMTKLLSHSEGLVLVYTRITDDNGNAFRNRAPLFIADLDPETLSLKRSTERIIVSNKGLPLGNFWVWPVNQHKSYVVTAEWPRDGRMENGDIWLTKIRWRNPNLLMTKEGAEVLN